MNMNKEIENLLEMYKKNLFETEERFRELQTETEFGKWIAYSQIVDDLEKIIKKEGNK